MNQRDEVIDEEQGELKDLNRNGIGDEIEPPLVDITAGSKRLAARLRNNSATNPTLSGVDRQSSH
jgi:hypothetical protein